MKRLCVDFTRSGKSINDWDVESFCNTVYKNFQKSKETLNIEVCNEIVILRFRAMVAEGLIKPEEIVFIFKCDEIKVNKHGRLLKSPKDFCDRSDNYLDKILDL